MVVLSEARKAVESRRAAEVEATVREWRRTWRRVFAQCVGLALGGTVLYGVSFGLTSGTDAELVAAAAFLVGYVIPFFRLVFFFVKHADQF